MNARNTRTKAASWAEWHRIREMLLEGKSRERVGQLLSISIARVRLAEFGPKPIEPDPLLAPLPWPEMTLIDDPPRAPWSYPSAEIIALCHEGRAEIERVLADG